MRAASSFSAWKPPANTDGRQRGAYAHCCSTPGSCCLLATSADRSGASKAASSWWGAELGEKAEFCGKVSKSLVARGCQSTGWQRGARDGQRCSQQGWVLLEGKWEVGGKGSLPSPPPYGHPSRRDARCKGQGKTQPLSLLFACFSFLVFSQVVVACSSLRRLTFLP